MTDLIFPTDLRVSRAQRIPTSNSVSARSTETGKVFTNTRQGDKFKFGIRTEFASNRTSDYERARLEAFAARLRGSTNKFWFTPPGYTPRGSFPATELLTNNTFANGTTGWSVSNGTLTVADRALRAKFSTSAQMTVTQSATLAASIPYALRSFFANTRTAATSLGPIIADIGGLFSTDYQLPSARLATATLVAGTSASTAQYAAVASTGPILAGDYFDLLYTSLSRCFQIDNGPNLITRSDDLSHADWSLSNATITANAATAPDGTSTADAIVETTANASHFAYQQKTVSSAAADYSFSCALHAGSTRIHAALQLQEGTGGTAAEAVINLSTGDITSFTPGANWSNLRAYKQDLGGGWYYFAIVARKTNAATTIQARIFPLDNDDGSFSYVGDVNEEVYAWRATLAQSSVPTRLVQTTTTATTGTAQTGPGIDVKGLAAPSEGAASGLLLQSDFVQIGTELHMADASLDRDAAGLGYLQLAWPLKTSTTDSAPVIVKDPMGRFVMIDPYGGSSDLPGGIADFDFVCEEAG